MTAVMPVVFIGTLVLILAARLVLRETKKRDTGVTIGDYSAARAALDAVFVETAVVRRIFAADDIGFIAEDGGPEVQKFFVRERKRLAIQWLRTTEKQVRELMDLHLKLASYTYEPSPKFEFDLTMKYLYFVLAAKTLLMVVWLFGPFEGARITSYTMRSAEHFCSVFSIRLEKVDSLKLSSAS